MDTQVTENIFPDILEESRILVKKALLEIRTMGNTTVLCPLCKEVPELESTVGGERTVISCRCKYLYDVEMNL